MVFPGLSDRPMMENHDDSVRKERAAYSAAKQLLSRRYTSL